MSVGPRGARGRSAGLSPPSQPGSPLFRGPWRRPCRTAGGVEHRGSGASVLRGLHPSSRHPAGLSLKAPQGKGGWQRVHRSAPRRDTAWGEKAARSRSQKALLRGEGEGAVCGGRWELGSTGPPRPPRSRGCALSDPVQSGCGPGDLPRSGSRPPRSPVVRLFPARHKSCSRTQRPETKSPPHSEPPALLRPREASRKGLAVRAADTVHSAF